jgi:hypothetical protein
MCYDSKSALPVTLDNPVSPKTKTAMNSAAAGRFRAIVYLF